ncbi:4-(cytidine 5'-diphospho)-2-C-methyl-D-erythritol kinase [Angustibacter speluncae]
MTVTADGVRVRVPAKINLGLAVGPPRPDGFHELATVYQAVSLYDDLHATPADDVTVEVEGEGADAVPADGSNLAVRAARLLAERAGVAEGAHLRVTKRIPVAGGMAGGSADAAAALVACDVLWRTGLARDELADLAAQLGSDVPFSLVGGTAVGTGRGERVSPALARGEYHWVLALADGGLSTPAVYAECDRLRDGRDVPDPVVPASLMQALRTGDPAALGAALHNDLQPAALSLAPDLQRTLEVGEGERALGALVSGSGPTVAFLVPDNDAALDLSVALSASGTCRDVLRVTAPVGGARVVEQVVHR